MHVDNFPASDLSTGPAPVLPISDRRLRLLNVASEAEAGAGAGAPCFGSRLLAQLSLPYRDPGNMPEWVRRNNALTLTLTPGPVTISGQRQRLYPYGVIPRYLLTWVTTEVITSHSRVLELGGSLSAFLRELGLNSSGASGRRTLDQLRRLAVAQLNIEDSRQIGSRQHIVGENFSVASSYDLWFGVADPEQPSLLPSTITLSERFYAETLRAPVKLNPQVLRALSGSPMRIDMYTWLAFRTRNLAKASVVSWKQLQEQFGADYRATRQFRAAFLRNLEEVLLFFPEKSVTLLPSGVRLNARPKALRSKNLGQISA